ncbi:hypothetical protein Tco_1110339 [Tanacetum coccineum]|uniref:Uncharacterized protein n=1 Tax=Tanacetum coccineum TaxID=301880 RepID=A0ABQ5IIY5_9ASTR
MKEKDVDDVVEEQILTIKLKAEDSSKKLMKYKLKITNSDDKNIQEEIGDASFQLKSESLPHAQMRKNYKTSIINKIQDIMTAQELKTKTSRTNSDIQRSSFKDIKSQTEKTKSKDNDKGSRSKIKKHEGTSLQHRQRQRSQELNVKSNLIDLTKECTTNETHFREIVSLNIESIQWTYPSPSVVSPVLPAAALLPVDTTGTPSSTTSDQDTPSASTSPTTTEEQPQRNQNA